MPRHCCYMSSSDVKLKHSRKLHTNHQIPYESSFRSQTNVHLGQRKLLLSEIQLISEHYRKYKEHPIVMYVGAAPGNKNLILSDLFPKVKFVLYDGAKYDAKLKQAVNDKTKHYANAFELHEGDDGFFTDEKCFELSKQKRFKDRPLLFVSDIRLGEKDFEGGVKRDMDAQMKWVKMLKPCMSLLKFRFPYTMKHGDTMSYMPGVIWYGIWAKEQSGETRLLVRQSNVNKTKEYDFKAYEESMFFHNKYARPYCYGATKENGVTEDAKRAIALGKYCQCYDCIAELKIITEYLALSIPGSKFNTFDKVVNLINSLPPGIWIKKADAIPMMNIDQVIKKSEV